MAAQQGQLIGERYRLEERLSLGSGAEVQGELWRASDLLAAEAPMALRLLGREIDLAMARQRWGRLQGVLHPQVPRMGAAIEAAEGLWLVREWQAGRTYQQLLEARAARQLVFGAGEVLLLLRQLLPVLAVLHSQELVHGDLSPANLLRRDSDGLPVLIDFGSVAGAAQATPGYAPPERTHLLLSEPWMDLHALGVVALVLLSGEGPARLLDPVSLAWRWPATLAGQPELQAQISRLLLRQPGERFGSAAKALAAFQALAMPESTGPVPRADSTVALVPPPVAERPAAPVLPVLVAPPPQPEPAPVPGPAAAPRTRLEEREEAAEGGIWPVVIALVLSAVVGTALGWWWLSRGRVALTTPDAALQLPTSLPPAEVDQRQQLLNRLRALQIDRGWFLKLVDASLLAQFPERGGRLPGDSLEEAPLRKVWNELAEEWLARVEQLPLDIRRRLGSYTNGDWERRQQSLVSQGLSPAVLRQLVSGSAQNLLPGRPGADIPAEPFRQLWYAAAEQGLANVQIEAIQAQPLETRVLSAQVEAGGGPPLPRAAARRLSAGAGGEWLAADADECLRPRWRPAGGQGPPAGGEPGGAETLAGPAAGHERGCRPGPDHPLPAGGSTPAPGGPAARRPRALTPGAAGPAGEAPGPDRAGPRPACRRPAAAGAAASQLTPVGQAAPRLRAGRWPPWRP